MEPDKLNVTVDNSFMPKGAAFIDNVGFKAALIISILLGVVFIFDACETFIFGGRPLTDFNSRKFEEKIKKKFAQKEDIHLNSLFKGDPKKPVYLTPVWSYGGVPDAVQKNMPKFIVDELNCLACGNDGCPGTLAVFNEEQIIDYAVITRFSDFCGGLAGYWSGEERELLLLDKAMMFYNDSGERPCYQIDELKASK